MKFAWDAAGQVGNFSLDIIKGIPDGVSQGSNNISKLCTDAPFGWIPRVIKNVLWNCIAVPMVKFASGVIGIIVLTPVTFLGLSIIGCVGKFLLGNLGAGLAIVGSLVPLISGFITLGAMANRFPKESDNGT